MRFDRRDIWPDERRQLLFRAAVAPTEAAAAAWSGWRRITPLDDLDGVEFFLLPSVWANLGGTGALGDDAGRVRGTARQAWLRSELVTRAHRALADRLADGGLTAAPVHGLGVAAHLPDPRSRPLPDGGLLVAAARFADALRVARSAGFSPVRPIPDRELRSSRLRLVVVADADGTHVHLYRRLLGASDDAAIVEEGAAGSDRLLVGTLLHGVRGSGHPGHLWPLDAARLVTAGTSATVIDEIAGRTGARLEVGAGLSWLRDRLGFELPPDHDRLADPRPGPAGSVRLRLHQHVPAVAARLLPDRVR